MCVCYLVGVVVGVSVYDYVMSYFEASVVTSYSSFSALSSSPSISISSTNFSASSTS